MANEQRWILKHKLTKLSKEEAHNLKSINELKDYHFLVENYQRGYKWGIQQIEELLTDIQEFSVEKESFYCLQPVVVKQLDDMKFELIDGQQRLTTIFIILKCLEEDIYTISYNTRESSEEFLDSIHELEIVDQLDINADINNEIIPLLNNAWNNYVQINLENDNIDNYHFYCAYQYIKKWLVSVKEQQTGFRNNLLESTKVIWHNPEINQQDNIQTAEEIFINFNQGKIDLAQAELLKALFVIQLSQEANIELRIFKINQFSEEWNAIENKLQDNKFWYFVSNDISDNRKSNRIDLLFDLVKEKPKRSNDRLYSYHQYLKKYKNNKTLDWETVRDLFNQLNEWFTDRNLYHLIGYIVYENMANVSDLKKLYETVDGKEDFSNKLKELINTTFFKGSKKDLYNIDTVTYESNPKQIQTILLLHNVINYQITDSYYRFPFDRLKTERGWSLEHIHAQNTDDFETIKDINEWLNDIEALKKDFIKNGESFSDEKLLHLKNKIIGFKGVEKINNEIKPLVKTLDEEVSVYFQKHNISNLCLLDRRTNSSLGKKFFSEKRAEIVKTDKMTLLEYNDHHNKNEDQKPFIPLSTKQAFLKYYSQDVNEIQFTFWGYKDREDYKKHIMSSINDYLGIEKNNNHE